MSSRRVTTVLFVLGLASGAAPAEEAAAPASIAVVVGTASAIRQVSLDTLRELYLRRRRVWPDGDRALPVNLPADSAVRGAFSKRVLGRLPRDLVSYWQRLYFDGIRPPLVLKTPRAVCAYVAVEPSAIGYVPLDDVDGDSCRAVRVLEGP